jgi:hypothetical protein
LAQALQIAIIDEFGGEGEHGLLPSAEQHRFAAAQRHDRRVEGATGRAACRQR